MPAVEPIEGHFAAFAGGAVVILGVGAGLEIQLLVAPVRTQCLMQGAIFASGMLTLTASMPLGLRRRS